MGLAAVRPLTLFVALVTCCGVARADIAPPPIHMGAPVMPKEVLELDGHLTSAAFLAEEAEDASSTDAPVGVSLLSQRIEMDVLPTLIHVRAEYELKDSGQGASGLVLGVPESLPDVPYPLPAEDVTVSVDGAPAEVQRVTVEVPAEEIARLLRAEDPDADPLMLVHGISRWAGPSSWHTWTVDLEPGEGLTAVVEYNQVFADHHAVVPSGGYSPGSPTVMHLLSAGRVWDGEVGTTDVTVRTHGLDDDAVTVQELPDTMMQISVQREAALFEGDGLVAGLEYARDLAREIDLLHRYVLLVSSLQAHTVEYGPMDVWVTEADLLAWEELLEAVYEVRDDRHASARDRSVAARLAVEIEAELAGGGSVVAGETAAWGTATIVQRQRHATCWRCRDEENTRQMLALARDRLERRQARHGRRGFLPAIVVLAGLLGTGLLVARRRLAPADHTDRSRRTPDPGSPDRRGILHSPSRRSPRRGRSRS